MLIVLLGIVESRFERRHSEDQPTVSGIYKGKFEHIAEERPVGFRILAVDDHMSAVDHALNPNLPERGDNRAKDEKFELSATNICDRIYRN